MEMEIKEAFDRLRKRCIEKGLKGVNLQLNMHKVCYHIHNGDRIMRIDEVINYFGFESCTNYQMINVLQDNLYGTYADAVKDVFL